MTNIVKKKGGKPKWETRCEPLNATPEAGLKQRIRNLVASEDYGKISGFIEEAMRRELERRQATATSDAERAAVDELRSQVEGQDLLIIGRNAEDFITRAINHCCHYLRLLRFREAVFDQHRGFYVRYQDSAEQRQIAADEAKDFLTMSCRFDDEQMVMLRENAYAGAIDEAGDLLQEVKEFWLAWGSSDVADQSDQAEPFDPSAENAPFFHPVRPPSPPEDSPVVPVIDRPRWWIRRCVDPEHLEQRLIGVQLGVVATLTCVGVIGFLLL